MKKFWVKSKTKEQGDIKCCEFSTNSFSSRFIDFWWMVECDRRSRPPTEVFMCWSFFTQTHTQSQTVTQSERHTHLHTHRQTHRHIHIHKLTHSHTDTQTLLYRETQAQPHRESVTLTPAHTHTLISHVYHFFSPLFCMSKCHLIQRQVCNLYPNTSYLGHLRGVGGD